MNFRNCSGDVLLWLDTFNDNQKVTLSRKISCERISASPAMSNTQESPGPITMTKPILDSLAKYQVTMTEMETQARQVMGVSWK